MTNLSFLFSSLWCMTFYQFRFLQKISVLVVFAWLILFYDFCFCHIHPGIQILYLHGSDTLNINPNICKDFYKIRVCCQFAEQYQCAHFSAKAVPINELLKYGYGTSDVWKRKTKNVLLAVSMIVEQMSIDLLNFA